ncbi:MAG: sulfite dehydrogenase [Candidatus Acidiferrales bacterium]
MNTTGLSRRAFLTTASAAALGAAAATGDDIPRELGAPRRAYGERSPFEKSTRLFRDSPTPATSSSRTPLQDQFGIITPSSLHYEMHHSGVPEIDPRRHDVMIHGLVERALVFSMGDLHRLPSVSRIHFLECAGNSGGDHMGRPGSTPQRSHGLVSCSEWTGVTLGTLLEEAGLKPAARWIVAEGTDAGRMARSIPLEKALDDVLLAYGQNGEALRPEQGYPVRLVVPGWEGNVSIKWLGRIHVVDQPYMTPYETAYYTDLMPDGTARQFTFVMEAKSVITRPAGGQQLFGPGFYEITGLAWSGRGRITGVEVSTDGGKNWQAGRLNEPVLSKALTSFHFQWRWNGKAAVLQSRCTDETGYVQPKREQILAVRGVNATDHYNGIKVWHVGEDGKVSHE